MDEKKTSSGDTSLEEGNIFDEFSHAQEVGGEVKKIQEEEEKDVFYYIRKVGALFLIMNIILFIMLTLGFVYLYIQKGEEKKEYSFLAPLCHIFLGTQELGKGSCYGLNPVYQEYQTLYTQEKQNQVRKILPLLSEIYSFENFNASRKVEFLLDTEASRLRPLEILDAFDKIKFQFSPDDKADISCSNMDISFDKILSVSCTVYSSDWDSKIIGLDGGNISFLKSGGTAISRASSFINFIENKADSSFTILEKTQIFNTEDADIPPYTKKATIQLKLEYKDYENLYF